MKKLFWMVLPLLVVATVACGGDDSGAQRPDGGGQTENPDNSEDNPNSNPEPSPEPEVATFYIMIWLLSTFIPLLRIK